MRIAVFIVVLHIFKRGENGAAADSEAVVAWIVIGLEGADTKNVGVAVLEDVNSSETN